MKFNLALAATLVLGLLDTTAAHARFRFGTEGGNGGDVCEARFYEVRSDINTWIDNGGADSLKLPASVTLKSYKDALKEKMQSATVSCTTDALKIGSAEKTCVNKVEEGQAKIVCNTNLFMKTSDSSQYQLVHHEYAGLAGFEVNKGETSDYSISNQVTGFLEQTLVTKLAVKPTANTSELLSCHDGNSGGAVIKVENGYYIVSIYSTGYTTHLNLADAMKLPASELYSGMRLKMPASACSVNYAQARLSCSARNVVLNFTNDKGSFESVISSSVSIDTGLLGIGASSIQRIQFNVVTRDANAYSAMSFGARYQSVSQGKWGLCGKDVQ